MRSAISSGEGISRGAGRRAGVNEAWNWANCRIERAARDSVAVSAAHSATTLDGAVRRPSQPPGSSAAGVRNPAGSQGALRNSVGRANGPAWAISAPPGKASVAKTATNGRRDTLLTGVGYALLGDSFHNIMSDASPC